MLLQGYSWDECFYECQQYCAKNGWFNIFWGCRKWGDVFKDGWVTKCCIQGPIIFRYGIYVILLWFVSFPR